MMFNLKQTFNANNKAKDLPSGDSENVVNNISNWYTDKYSATLIQRNFLIILVLLSLIVVIASVVIVGNISSTFKIQPFVIEVEDKTGITSIVNPMANRDLTTSEVMNKYFITKYIKARETYSYETWRYNYLTVIRLLSTPSVYYPFRKFINVNPDSPLSLYGNQTSSSIVFRSIQFFPPVEDKSGRMGDPQAVVRFTLYADRGALKNAIDGKINKIVTLNYKYEQTEMNDDDRSVNPLGFYISAYRADIENDVVPVLKNNDKPSY
ncbi:MAG: type IV secretion system protein [Rickettsiales bacterium]